MRGGALESAVRQFLSENLPRKYVVAQGEIVDVQGHRSHQSDVVILNEEQPFQSVIGEPGNFIVEGVSAVGEVKSILDGNSLWDSIQKARDFRNLKPEWPTGTTAHGVESDTERYYMSAPFFLIAAESRVTEDYVLSVLSGDWNSLTTRSLDAVFVLGLGSFINFGDGGGRFQFRDGDGNSIPGWVHVSCDSLADLFVWLHAVMPRLQMSYSPAVQYLIRANVE